ncbi:hypothetical protein HanXRQr2_Chr15g0702511 [Helianthus annuus]|uniref:Uncharacterized protein n=1 Tax=Helianthus annuus TaxID=4232 RepID=A0A251T8B8_HELAN|nr:hypothetical protein HanXRQr2_Chr15g0702511 [Helianthus annuus]KAJ0451868.1 hypothetical protein HanHA300_Chr15g0572521 [Helianthus annuus]KAJ0473753.1 hypothetical protein HanHA89_Chr15g0622001 [Helianthus annuus]KAJ0507506.1 hypothetical protein HanIR_Chr11g0506961 [Helianthus annuus]KAJ0649329.1 hypothetical protein HanLR1_Chr15g0583091 [Helianthus annuus]
MMYKSFKHQKTSLSTYTLSPKLNTRTHKLGFLISHLVRRLSSHPLLSLYGDYQASLSDLARSVRISPCSSALSPAASMFLSL